MMTFFFFVPHLEQQCKCTVHVMFTLTLCGNGISAPESILRELDWGDFEDGFSRHVLSKAESYEKMYLLSAGFLFLFLLQGANLFFSFPYLPLLSSLFLFPSTIPGALSVLPSTSFSFHICFSHLFVIATFQQAIPLGYPIWKLSPTAERSELGWMDKQLSRIALTTVCVSKLFKLSASVYL